MKKEFLLSEIWSLSISAAFQRANVYGSEYAYEREDYKKLLKKHLISIAEQYKTPIDETTHIGNIFKISECGHQCLANKGNLNFGVSQKLLNLYLKYLWCLDLIPPPPHFPIDRLIQQKLKVKKIVAWTYEMNEDNYKEIIELAKTEAKSKNLSLAELELMLFERRNG
jgi:hypothetical protein